MLRWGGTFLTIISFCFTINYFNFSLSFVIQDDFIFIFFLFNLFIRQYTSLDLLLTSHLSRKIQIWGKFEQPIYSKKQNLLAIWQKINHIIRSPPLQKKKRKWVKKMGNSQKPEERWSLLHLDRFQWMTSIEKQKGYWFYRVPQSSLWIK